MSLFLASCSDSNTDNGSVINANIVGSAVKSTTDAQELAARVYNYKGIYAGTKTATAKTRAFAAKTRAGEGSEVQVPEGAIRLANVIKDNNWGKWNAHPGNYYIEDGDNWFEHPRHDHLRQKGRYIHLWFCIQSFKQQNHCTRRRYLGGT